VLQTGIFKPDEINREINQKVQKKIPLFNHKKQIAGHPSIGNILSGGQALEYAAQKFAATPTTGRYVAKNYANVLNDIGHCMTGGLGKDEGKRAHQTGAKDEKRYGNMANYEKKARSMSQYG
jgi:hypothetical protein